MAARGVYRGIYTAMLDDPDFQALPAPARHVLLTARLCRDAGPAAIFICYPEVLARQTGLPTGQVLTQLRRLAEAGWIEWDPPVLWIKNALRDDPHMRLNNPKHRVYVERLAHGLPDLPIIARFCKYYDLDSPSIAYRMGIDSLSIGTRITETEDRGQKTETEDREQRTEPTAVKRPPPPPHGMGGCASGLAKRPASPEAHLPGPPNGDFIASLRTNPAYRGIDIDRELSKMDAWLATPHGRSRRKTRQFIVAWLNRIDVPLPAGDPPIYNPQNIRAGQIYLDAMRERERRQQEREPPEETRP